MRMKVQMRSKKITKSAKSAISPEVQTTLNEHKKGMKQYVDTLAKALSKTLAADFQRERKSLSEDFQRERKALSEDVKRHIGALSEDFQGKVGAVAEQFGGLNDKVDEVIRVQNTHTEMIGTIMEDVSEIKIELKNKTATTESVRLERRVRVLEHAAL